MPRPIIIDCDPGQDDAVALLLALASPDELEVLGITCVAGNVPLPLTQRNARIVCELAGRTEVPVFAGCPRPILRSLRTAEAVHGKTGLDGAPLSEPRMPLQQRHAVDFIVDTCLAAADSEITLCPIGPMTNIALAIVKEPRILPKIREIVFMGGAAINPGNTTAKAEFNIYVDPHAAQVVLSSGCRLVMHGLDVTHQAITTPERLNAIRAIGTPLAKTVAGLLKFYDRHDIERYGMPGGPLHDPCAVAWLLNPDLFGGRRCHVAVETSSDLTLGQTVVDWWGVGKRQPNCLVVNRIDADGFYDLIIERLARL